MRTPKHWEEIVQLAAGRGATLPASPDGKALERFLAAAKVEDPKGFPDLSLSIIKLIGAGEYVVERPAGHSPGHFGLAVRDYTHSTAPNRRYPDLVTQRILKAAIARRPSPYANEELDALARHCTEQEDAAKKVERQVDKCAAAMLLTSRIGVRFPAMVTGASDKGTWVRITHPLAEGKLIDATSGLRVGDFITVQLVHLDVDRGHIDFRMARGR